MKAALAQLISAKGDPEANLKTMSEAIKAASAKGAELICFGELFYSGYDIDKETLEKLAIFSDGPETAKISELAHAYGVHVLFSYPERDHETGRVYISAMLIDDMGNILLNHRKTYRWADEKLKVSASSDGYEVCNTKYGRIGVLICYEMEFPEPARILMLQGAEIVLVTSAFSETDEMHVYLSALAIQNQFHILSTNDVCEEEPRRGTSCVVDQYGKIVQMLDDKEGILYCDIDLSKYNRRDTAPHMKDLKKDTFRMMTELAETSANPEPASTTARKYVKKPVIIEAYQTDQEMIIHTLEGDMKAMPGDYIITGVKGEQYPCKADIFEKTYEEV